MEEASDSPTPPPSSLDSNHDRLPPGRPRSDSASSGHKRSSSGSLLSKLSFLRMMQASHDHNNPPKNPAAMDAADDADDLGPGLKSGRAMSSALLQHRRTRRRRGSLRKTALLGTRVDYRDKKSRAPLDLLRGDAASPQYQTPPSSSLSSAAPPLSHGNDPSTDGYAPRRPSTAPGQEHHQDSSPPWTMMDDGPTRHPHPNTAQNNHLLGGGDITTDEEDIVSFPRVKDTHAAVAAAGRRLPTASSSSPDSYYALQADPAYRSMHRAQSPLATHPADMASPPDLDWDYSETEWWGWIILMVTWLVFVVGMGSCFGVWSWAWDVGETPYAPPELEDDPTLPIVGYYPALIILTAVMSWVWVVVAWVGMKYFKHANISGEDI